MKKILIIALAFMLTLTLTACGSTNASLASNMNNSLNKLNNYIKNIETIQDSEIVVSDLISDNAITTMRNVKPSEKITNSEALNDVKNVSGNPFVVPNFNRNTDTYGNYHNMNNRFGYGYNGYGYNNYNGGYNGYGYGYNGYGFPNGYGNGYPYGYGYNNFYNGNGIVGSNIDSYRENMNYNNLYNRLYRNNNITNNNAVNQNLANETTRRFQKNINTYRNIASNINTYKNANYESRYNVTNTGYETDLNNHYQKLNNLCAIQVDTLNCNDQTNSLKTRILANISYLNSLAEQIKSSNISVTDNQAKAVKDLLNNANNFANKINTSKNELKSELRSVSSMKVNYSANVDELSSKYVRLLNSLDTRNSYLQNILSSLLQVENTILSGYSNSIDVENQSTTYPTCPNCPYNDSTTMPPPRNTETAENINGSIDISGSETKISTDENGEIKEDTNSFQDRYIIENGKIKKVPQNENIEDVDHIVKDNPKKLDDKDIKRLQIAGERIASFIRDNI